MGISHLQSVKFQISTHSAVTKKHSTSFIETMNGGIKIGKDAFIEANNDYKKLRREILSILKENNMTIEDFLSEK